MLAGYDQLLAAARRLQWDAAAIELSADAVAARRLSGAERATLATLVAGFRIAEHAVADELAPYVAAAPAGSVARACFTVQAGDEARHARFFDRVAVEALGPAGLNAGPDDAPPGIRELFERELPATARALAADAGRLGDAVGLYHLVLEGIVFAVGQQALLELARGDGPVPRLPGTADGVARVQSDERWHVGLGVLSLQRLGDDRPRDRSGDGAGRLERRAAAASRAWGPEIATSERIAHALAVHARRTTIALGGVRAGA